MRNCFCNKMMINNENYQKNNKCCDNLKNNNNCNKVQENSNCCKQPNNENFCRNADCNNYMDDRNCPNRELMEQMRMDLKAYDFAIEDLALYLDTHPDDTRAVCLHNEYAKCYRRLSDEYQKVYGPLNIMYPCNSWRWIEEPWPWQKVSTVGMTNNRGKSSSNENDFKNPEETCDFELKGGIE